MLPFTIDQQSDFNNSHPILTKRSEKSIEPPAITRVHGHFDGVSKRGQMMRRVEPMRGESVWRSHRPQRFVPQIFLLLFLLLVVSLANAPRSYAMGGFNPFHSSGALAFSPEGDYIAYAPYYSGPVRTFRLKDGSLLHVFPFEWSAEDIDISRDGRLVAAGALGSTEPQYSAIRVWDVRTEQVVGERELGGRLAAFVQFSEDSSRLFHGSLGTTQVSWNEPKTWWNMVDEDGDTSNTAPLPPSASISIGWFNSSIAANYRRGVAATCQREAGSSIEVRQIAGGALIKEFPESRTVESLFFSREGGVLAAVLAGEKSSVRLWKTDSWDELEPLAVDGSVVHGALNGNGTLLALHAKPDTLIVWDLRTRRQLLSFSAILPEENLYKAAEEGDAQRVIAILGRDVNVDEPVGYRSTTPLLAAARRGHAAVVSLLIAAGADANPKMEGFWTPTPLRAALSSDDLQTVWVLIDAGADIGAGTDFRGMVKTCLAYAAGNCSPEIVSLLIERGDKLDAQSAAGYTALAEAAVFSELKGGRALKTIRVLLEAGVNPNLRTALNYTPLDLARARLERAESEHAPTSDVAQLREIVRLLEQATDT